MKPAMLVLVGFLLIPQVRAQEHRILFANTPATLISTNNGTSSGLTQGAGAYRFGLYMGPEGTPANSLTLVAFGHSISTAGRMSAAGDGTVALPGLFLGGATYAFQVRAWEAHGGATYDDALINPSAPLLGVSEMGFVTLPNSPSPLPIPIFGTDPGQVGGFVIGVPEPSTWALVGLAATLGWCCHRRVNSKR